MIRHRTVTCGCLSAFSRPFLIINWDFASERATARITYRTRCVFTVYQLERVENNRTLSVVVFLLLSLFRLPEKKWRKCGVLSAYLFVTNEREEIPSFFFILARTYLRVVDEYHVLRGENSWLSNDIRKEIPQCVRRLYIQYTFRITCRNRRERNIYYIS